MPRQRITAKQLQESINGHVLMDVATAYESIHRFLEIYELPGEVATNLLQSKKRISQAMALLKAAQAVASFQASEVE